MNNYIPEKLNHLEEYVPQHSEADIILDANESPFLPSQALREEIATIAQHLAFNRYPDSSSAEPVREFAHVYHLDERCIVMGNGSDELISLLESGFLTPEDTAVVVVPDFSMYAFYGSIVGAQVVKYIKSNDFSIDFEDLGQLCTETHAKMVIFSNPCNPTGRAYPRDAILRFTDSHDLLVVCDEAYMEFCTSDCSVLCDAASRENLIVLKTLSKACGMAALRAGFAVTNAAIASAVRKIKSPYNVNSFTQQAAAAVLRRYDEIRTNTVRIIAAKRRLEGALRSLFDGTSVTVYSSETNFVLLRADAQASVIFQKLLEQKIRVRFMGDFLRITAGTDSECDAVVAAVTAIVKEIFPTEAEDWQ